MRKIIGFPDWFCATIILSQRFILIAFSQCCNSAASCHHFFFYVEWNRIRWPVLNLPVKNNQVSALWLITRNYLPWRFSIHTLHFLSVFIFRKLSGFIVIPFYPTRPPPAFHDPILSTHLFLLHPPSSPYSQNEWWWAMRCMGQLLMFRLQSWSRRAKMSQFHNFVIFNLVPALSGAPSLHSENV